MATDLKQIEQKAEKKMQDSVEFLDEALAISVPEKRIPVFLMVLNWTIMVH